MAKTFEELLQETVNKDYSELLNLAKAALSDCVESLKAVVGEEHTVTLLVGFIGAAVASDGQYSPLEKQMMTDLFGNYEGIGKVAAATGAEQYAAIDSIVDKLPGDLKAKMCVLATYILAVDEHIDKNEYSYLINLMK